MQLLRLLFGLSGQAGLLLMQVHLFLPDSLVLVLSPIYLQIPSKL